MNIRFVFYGLILFFLMGANPALAALQGVDVILYGKTPDVANQCMDIADAKHTDTFTLDGYGKCVRKHFESGNLQACKDDNEAWKATCTRLEDYICKVKKDKALCKGYKSFIDPKIKDPLTGNLDVYEKFREQILKPGGDFTFFMKYIIKTAITIFIIMTIVELIWTFIRLAIVGTDFGEVSKELVIRIVIFSFGLWVLSNPLFATDIMFGLMDVAQKATRTKELHDASGLLNVVNDILQAFFNSLSLSDSLSPKTWFYAACVLLILWAFGTAAAQMVLVLCELYIVLAVGTLSLGLLPFEKTREFTMRYFSAVIGIGFKLFTLQFIIFICLNLVKSWSGTLEEDKTNIFFGQGAVGIHTYVAMVVASLILKEVAVKIPDYVQSLFSGASSGLSAAQAMGAAMLLVGVAKHGAVPGKAAVGVMRAAEKSNQSFYDTAKGAAKQSWDNFKTGGGTKFKPGTQIPADWGDKVTANADAGAGLKNPPNAPK